jgi:tellurite resistance protein TerC
VLLVGIALVILPGPAFIVIPAGLAILATEFHWARRCKDRCKQYVDRVRERHRQRKKKRADALASKQQLSS